MVSSKHTTNHSQHHPPNQPPHASTKLLHTHSPPPQAPETRMPRFTQNRWKTRVETGSTDYCERLLGSWAVVLRVSLTGEVSCNSSVRFFPRLHLAEMFARQVPLHARRPIDVDGSWHPRTALPSLRFLVRCPLLLRGCLFRKLLGNLTFANTTRELSSLMSVHSFLRCSRRWCSAAWSVKLSSALHHSVRRSFWSRLLQWSSEPPVTRTLSLQFLHLPLVSRENLSKGGYPACPRTLTMCCGSKGVSFDPQPQPSEPTLL